MKKTTYINFDLIDVNAKNVVKDSYMVVEDEKIARVGKVEELNEYETKEAVDLTGKTVMPGMFNCHVHILSTPIGYPAKLNHETPGKFTIRGMLHLHQQLKSGVTFVRDMNGRKLVEMDLRESLREGLIKGPDMYVCRDSICMTGGHGWFVGREVDGVVESRKAAREQIKAGADFIKIMATGGIKADGEQPGEEQLTEDEIRAAVEVAHKSGRKTAAHAQGTEGIKNALRAGIDSIEHGIMLDNEAIEMMLKNKTTLVPTLAASYFIIKNGVKGGVPAFAVEKAKRYREKHIGSFIKAWKAGVKIGTGTDAGTPYNLHSESYIELCLMVEAGLSPMDAIVAATKSSSEVVGVDSWAGTLEKGKKANFLVLDENPLDNIYSLKNIGQVYKDGELVRI